MNVFEIAFRQLFPFSSNFGPLSMISSLRPNRRNGMTWLRIMQISIPLAASVILYSLNRDVTHLQRRVVEEDVFSRVVLLKKDEDSQHSLKPTFFFKPEEVDAVKAVPRPRELIRIHPVDKIMIEFRQAGIGYGEVINGFGVPSDSPLLEWMHFVSGTGRDLNATPLREGEVLLSLESARRLQLQNRDGSWKREILIYYSPRLNVTKPVHKFAKLSIAGIYKSLKIEEGERPGVIVVNDLVDEDRSATKSFSAAVRSQVWVPEAYYPHGIVRLPPATKVTAIDKLVKDVAIEMQNLWSNEDSAVEIDMSDLDSSSSFEMRFPELGTVVVDARPFLGAPALRLESNQYIPISRWRNDFPWMAGFLNSVSRSLEHDTTFEVQLEFPADAPGIREDAFVEFQNKLQSRNLALFCSSLAAVGRVASWVEEELASLPDHPRPETPVQFDPDFKHIVNQAARLSGTTEMFRKLILIVLTMIASIVVLSLWVRIRFECRLERQYLGLMRALGASVGFLSTVRFLQVLLVSFVGGTIALFSLPLYSLMSYWFHESNPLSQLFPSAQNVSLMWSWPAFGIVAGTLVVLDSFFSSSTQARESIEREPREMIDSR